MRLFPDYLPTVDLPPDLTVNQEGVWEYDTGNYTKYFKAIMGKAERQTAEAVSSWDIRVIRMEAAEKREEDDAGAGTMTLRHIYGTLILGLEFKPH